MSLNDKEDEIAPRRRAGRRTKEGDSYGRTTFVTKYSTVLIGTSPKGSCSPPLPTFRPGTINSLILPWAIGFLRGKIRSWCLCYKNPPF